MGDYYITLVDSSIAIVKGVTVTPTLVPQSIMDAYYRDDGVFVENTGNFSSSPVSTDATTGTHVDAAWTPTSFGFLSDPQMHIEPRQLQYQLSYWQFTVGSLSYFYRWDAVQGFGTDPPPFF